ncbi:hypothetical protein P8Q88_11055 [Qipengyuania sp. XHP0207]|uniref:hypothetical protein n=1 Tax=Qipengyuania sp. XHP0207 TaxID=3038078 RepID=UPI00242047C9|nr:hypothetical protein [Qipengyuania sp. XHP0207]MDG5748711.1 hypothetical protein [Qipengyuania sp. XHP0207]
MKTQVGEQMCFQGYTSEPSEWQPNLSPGRIVVIFKDNGDGEYLVFPLSDEGQFDPLNGEVVFQEEMIKLPLPRLPRDALAAPFGTGLVVEPRRTSA